MHKDDVFPEFSMASVTRSRRADALDPGPYHSLAASPATHARPNRPNTSAFKHNQSLPTPTIAKRQREEPIGIDTLSSPKRQRLTINLSSSPNEHFQPRPPSDVPNPTHPPNQPRPGSRPESELELAAPPPSPPAPTETHKKSEKTDVVKPPNRPRNAVNRELENLQIKASESKVAEGRKLRSQEATRFKSDLAAYFPDYDEIIGNDPRQEQLLEPETPIVVTDDTDAQDLAETPIQTEFATRRYGDHLFTDLFDSQEISFDFLQSHTKGDDMQDPLPDSSYEPAHKKAERAEKSIRNNERGRAQHEKEQIIRLLGALQGHDWLKIMGVNAATGSKKKEFEAARRYFIKGCEAILEKFKQWGVEEKRRKLEKERALAAAARFESGEAPSEEEGSQNGLDGNEADEVSEMDSGDPEDSDVGASIAKQLGDEFAEPVKKPARRARRGQELLHALSPAELVPLKPFTSFFDKKYQRDAALSRNRRKGRKVLAWGHAVPEMPEAYFELPPEFLDEKTLQSNARRRRRDKRGVRR